MLTRQDLYHEQVQWQSFSTVPPVMWTCGFCHEGVSSIQGYIARNNTNNEPYLIIRLCPNCLGPTVFTSDGKHSPVSPPGKEVKNLPQDLSDLYEEARRCAGAGSYTGAVLLCRKMLMNIAVDQGAAENESFLFYVNHLSDNGFIPPNGRGWVDYIRTKGNEATHEIELMTDEDAKALITFVEMLLRFIHEFPNMVPGNTNTP